MPAHTGACASVQATTKQNSLSCVHSHVYVAYVAYVSGFYVYVQVYVSAFYVYGDDENEQTPI